MTTINALELKTVITPTTIELQIWLKAGVSIDAIDLALNYNASQANYVDSTPNNNLTSWTLLANEASKGHILIGGYGITAIQNNANVLLESVFLTPIAGQTNFNGSLVDGTGLSFNNISVPLGNLPEVFIYDLTETNTIITSSGSLTGSFVQTKLTGTYGDITIKANGSWSYVTNSAHNEFIAGHLYTDTFSFINSNGLKSTLNFAINGTNENPSFTAFSAPVTTGKEDTVIPITFANLKLHSDAIDTNGSIKGFVVTDEITQGSLKIGTSATNATAWNIDTNNLIDATHKAFWTPTLNENGNLAAFKVLAKDNDGYLSSDAVIAQINVTPVNDAPTFSSKPLDLSYADTILADNFINQTGQLDKLVTDVDSSNLTYGIKGGKVSREDNNIITFTNTYGTLSITKDKGDYSFTPNIDAINLLSTNKSATFTLTVSDGIAKPVNTTLNLIFNQNGTTESKGNDVLIGTFSDEKFAGLAGNDTINAGDGNDILIGGLGTDQLTGGNGNDTFVFNLITESVKGKNHDTITDFNPSDGDKINLSAIDANTKLKNDGNQGFHFINEAPFTGSAGDLRYSAGILSGDTNGDKKADFEIAITLVGSNTLSETDIIL